MTDSEAMLHEANRRAHRLARASLRAREHGKNPRLGYWQSRQLRLEAEVTSALDAYEEIEERQQKEATL